MYFLYLFESVSKKHEVRIERYLTILPKVTPSWLLTASFKKKS